MISKKNPKRKHDPQPSAWDNPRFTKRVAAYVEILYLTREQATKGIPEKERKGFWPKGTEHLEEVAIHIPASKWPAFREWFEGWGHKGGSFYLSGKKGYAVRAGGVHQNKDPLNVFFLEG